MKDIRRGEVYYIDRIRDEVGSEQYSGRPAIIVSNDCNNRNSSTVEVIYLTTQPKKDLQTHVFIPSFMGVPRDSIALCEQITTVSKVRLGKVICILSPNVMEQIDRAMMVSLGIALPNEEHREECVDAADEPAETEIKNKEAFTEREKQLIHRIRGIIYEDLYYNLLNKIIN